MSRAIASGQVRKSTNASFIAELAHAWSDRMWAEWIHRPDLRVGDLMERADQFHRELMKMVVVTG